MIKLLLPIMMFGASVALGEAQTVHGTVTDSATSQPLGRATVELQVADGRIAGRDIADQQGRFRVRAQGEGAYRLRVRLVGYRVHESPALVLTSHSDTTISVQLAAVAVELDSVSVTATAKSRYLEGSGFYRRMLSGPGQFLLPSQVDSLALKAREVTDLLQHITEATLVRAGGAWQVWFTRRGRGCGQPRVYLDGIEVRAPPGQPLDVNALLGVEQMFAVEAYSSAVRVPLEYGGADAACGVLLIWTRH